MEPQRRPYRWLILGVVWLLYAAFGLGMRSMPPLVTPMLRDLDMVYSEMGFILGTWQLVYIPVAIFAGAAIDRFGVRRSLFVGALIMAVSVGLRYTATGFVTLLPMVALFGVGAPLISIGAPKTVAEWFEGKGRAVAVGIYTTAPWLGGLFALAATNSLIMPMMDYSWRHTFLFYSGLVFLFAIIWGLTARDIRKGTTVKAGGLRETFVRLMKVHNVRVVVAAGLLYMFMEHGFSHWLPKVLESSGMTPETAGFVASVPLLAALPAVLFIPGLVKRRFRGRALGLMALLSAAALMAVVTAPSTGLVIGGLVLYGLLSPVMIPMLMLVLMDDPEVGSENMGLAGGIFFSVAEIGGFSGPALMGLMKDVTGVFLPGAMMLAGVGVLLAALTFWLKRVE